jgi:hypothetical protein
VHPPFTLFYLYDSDTLFSHSRAPDRCSQHPHLSSSMRPSSPVSFLVYLRFYLHPHRTIPGRFNTEFIGPPLQTAKFRLPPSVSPSSLGLRACHL